MLLDHLNPEQLAAVTLPQEHALVLAGAGSGKTRVLTTRAAWLIQTGQCSPAQIMAVTFTNKAAREMLTRLSAMLTISVRGMWVGTFHGLCNRFLRAHAKEANLPATFQILDMQDQLSAIKRLLKERNIDEQHISPKELQFFINRAKEQAQRAQDCVARDAVGRQMIELYVLYDAQCQREGVVDFAELLLRTYEMLRDLAPLREHYRNRFQHILVDEFQDTNRLQFLWLKLLTGERSALFVVGDDDQSIYAFRGARAGNMDDYRRDFQVQHLIKLEQNYRSFGNILDAANHLISHNENRLGKNLRTDQTKGEPVRIMESVNDLQEAIWVIEELRQLKRDGHDWLEMALLYRSNAQSRTLENQLFSHGIPYRVYGGLRFFERAEVKHALAYLRLLSNPNDDTSFQRVVNFPARGIGARSLEQLQDVARETQCSLYQAIDLPVHAKAAKLSASIKAFAALLSDMLRTTQGLPLPQVVEEVTRKSGLLDHYRLEREGQDRVENLEELVNAAAAFVRQEGFGEFEDAFAPVQLPPTTGGGEARTMSPLDAFLSHAALEAGDNQSQAGQSAVQLMTVHSAKGLEFDVVFITGLEEGLFPHENSLYEQGGLEEERRLMYVAITRARQRLYLSFAQSRLMHGQTRFNLRSRFLEELPEESLKWLKPKQSGFGNRLASDDTYQSSRSYAPVSAPVSAPVVQGNPRLRHGQRVFHNKFGEGVVSALEGSGTEAKAQIHFNRHGPKWLLLAIANLQLVD